MKRLITYLFTLLFGSVGAQDLSLFKASQYQNDQGQVFPYRILFPKDYNKSQKYPLVLFLHGAGERGNDNESQLVHGVKTFLEGENRDNFPCIVLAPQCPKESYWSSVTVDRSQYPVTLDFDYKRDATHPLAMTIELLKKLTKEEAVDPDRVYITGLSMGGMGTMEALYRHPELFAAAASVCGGGQAEAFDKRYGSIPLWLFHGDVDGVVKVEQSRELFTHFQATGLDVRYTEYPGVNHNSWENAYAEKDLLPWLFSHSRKKDDLPVVVGKNKAIVATTYGKVRGSIHRNIYTYKGIPYAKARRFQAPQQPDSWQGIRSSMSYGPVCPLLRPTTQVDDAGEFAFHHDWGYPNEDCLRLNIWTPGINDDKKRPVMLWFHGGGYTAGSSQELPSYDGESISRKGDVVLVSINHRLNVLGFLDLSAYGEEYQSSGNVGMMDLQASLEWIRDNIAAFGGDPNNVTIFGQSGGGGKVTTLMNAPSCKGLFHKAIVQSGVGVRFQDPAMSRRVGKAVVEALGIDPTQMTQIEEVPMDRLAEVAQEALGKVRDELEAEGKEFGVLGLGWGPVLDGHFLPFQTNTPQADALSADV
ncbi:MAG: carboxylesterase family protein, partial [Bacteroidota bacterium]